MSLFNLGCCGPQGCGISESKKSDDLRDDEIVFEEVN
jgi:hypothetical protein